MNRRYMDFVPANSKKAPVKKVETVKRVERFVQKTEVVSRGAGENEEKIVKETVRVGTPSVRDGIEFGVIEDLNPERMGDNVGGESFKGEDEIKAIKAKKISGKVEEKKVEKEEAEKKQDYKVPKSPFINQAKVEKRPLSKNVYRKEIEVPKEEPKGPTTIITKPEKDAHVSLIVTIILTIILGAAAGTVAFLLLPK